MDFLLSVQLHFTINQIYKDLSYKISRECHVNKRGELKITDRGKTLMLARSRIVAGAKQKISALKDQIEPYKDEAHMLIYCGATRVFNFDVDSTVRDNEGERQIRY